MTLSRVFLGISSSIAAITFVGAVIAGWQIMSSNRGSDDTVLKSDLLVLEALEKFESGDTTGSRGLTERVLSISPSEPIARANLGRIYKAQGDYARAIAEHKLAIAVAPDLPDLYYNVACYYALSKRKEDALRWLGLALDHGFARLDHLRGDADLDSLEGDPRFDLLARTGTLASGMPRVKMHSSAQRARVGVSFEVSVVVEREVPKEQAAEAATSLTIEWKPDEPLTLVQGETTTKASVGDGFVTLRTVGRWVVKGPEEGMFALPAARVMATVDGTDVIVMSDPFLVEIVDPAAEPDDEEALEE